MLQTNDRFDDIFFSQICNTIEKHKHRNQDYISCIKKYNQMVIISNSWLIHVYLLLSCLSMWFFISWFLNVYTQIIQSFPLLFRIAKGSYTHLPHSVSIARQWRSKYSHLISVILWLTSNVSDYIAYWNKYQYINSVQTKNTYLIECIQIAICIYIT